MSNPTQQDIKDLKEMHRQYEIYGNIRNFPMMFMMGKQTVDYYTRPNGIAAAGFSERKQRGRKKHVKRIKQVKGQQKLDKYIGIIKLSY